MRKRPVTPGYVFFFILFWPDTWRILIGVAVAGLSAPRVIPPEMGVAGAALICVMLAAIGYAVGGLPARWISDWLKTRVLGKRRP